MSSLINCQSISKSHGSKILFKTITLGIHQGDKIGMIGPNGAGKSTFFKVLMGIENPEEGKIIKQRDLRIGYVSQESTYPDLTIQKILLSSFKGQSDIPDYEQETLSCIILSKVGFNDFNQKASALSGGWIKRLAIAKALILSPELLLLDEPTNHLDLESIIWLEAFLARLNCSFMLISHDRYFLENSCNRIIELNPAYPNGFFSASGKYSKFLDKRDDFLKGQKEYEQSLSSKVRKEIEWLKQTPKARTTKSHSRVDEANRLIKELSQVKQRNLDKKVDINFSSSVHQSKKLITLTNVSKTMGCHPLFQHLNLTLYKGIRLGIAGRNGTGKTTLLKILAKELKPDTGKVNYADNLRVVYFDQKREQPDLSLTLKEALSPAGEFVTYKEKNIHVRSWCKRFLFSPDLLDLPIRSLSGGERARISIARLMLKSADLLLLDEPTNDLDIQTLEILEESLEQFTGAIVFITHDRFMLDNLASLILGLGISNEDTLFADYKKWEEASAANSTNEKTISKKTTSNKKKSLSYKEKKELQEIAAHISKLEKEMEVLTKQMEDPLIQSQLEKVIKIGQQLDQIQKKIDGLYQRWEELEQKSS